MNGNRFCLRLSLLLSSFAALLAPQLAAQQCQNQVCYYAGQGSCYKCQNQADYACSVPQGQKCAKQCTDTACLSAPVNSSAADSQASKAACRVSLARLAMFRKFEVKRAAYRTSSSMGNSSPGVLFLLDPGTTKDPVVLLSVTHDADKDLFDTGIAENAASTGISAYRIGVILYPTDSLRRPVAHLGPTMNLPGGVAAGAQFTLPQQGVSPSLMNGVRALVFFVAEVRFSNGSTWKADIPQIAKTYQEKLNP